MGRLVVLLTGGIGSGKTTVSDLFAERAVDVVDSDIAARTILLPGTVAYTAVRSRFGDGLFAADGTLDRAQLRRIVFADREQRRWLEQLTHPLIGRELKTGIERTQSPYCLLVVPLFVPGRRHPLAHRVLLVDAPEALQIQRAMARDGNSAAQVQAIMAAQATRQQRIDGADDVIVNAGDVTDLIAQIYLFDKKYRELAGQT